MFLAIFIGTFDKTDCDYADNHLRKMTYIDCYYFDTTKIDK